MGEAFTWVSRITAVGLGMALPAAGGSWLDARLGTRFLGPLGVVAGLALALVWVIRLGATAPVIRRRKKPGADRSPKGPAAPPSAGPPAP